MANRLASETSPYLLQHAHNPVDWHPWGEEAFEKAVAEDKPMLVSIGYSACHWCHVMERESFENDEVAAIMNEHFINIKVDREERPDVDAVYMDAVQAIAGNGGWPLNVFLTPDKRPFYGGTYFPPQRAFNRASWPEVLNAVAQSFREKRDEIETQAENLTEHLKMSNSVGGSAAELSEADVSEAVAAVMKQADREWGGFGRAPKFPQTFTINFLLQWAWYQQNETEEKSGNEPLEQALLSINKMIQGGIYDHIGGGFARYSTDQEWLVPHFEKMLYDNALLVATLCDAYRFTKDEQYVQTIAETLGFVERELTHPGGGFFSALDADSEGEEGKFYVWQREEVEQVLGNEAGLFCDYFDIQPEGNWEGKSIPWVLAPLKEFAAQNGLDAGSLADVVADGKAKLLAIRGKRVRPQLDDKILLSWNALMNIAYSKAYAATGNAHYLAIAKRNMAFMLTAFGSGEALHHSWKDEKARHPSFLDDYAYLIAALIELAQVSLDYSYLQHAASLTETVLNRFTDEASPLFFYTAEGQKDILIRKKEVYDGATPSGNAVMAINLHQLSILLDKPLWDQRAKKMISAMASVAVRYPTSFGVWLAALFEYQTGTAEVAIVGDDYAQKTEDFQKQYLPHTLYMAAKQSTDEYSLLAGKQGGGKSRLYLCKNYACASPVSTLSALISLLKSK